MDTLMLFDLAVLPKVGLNLDHLRDIPLLARLRIDGTTFDHTTLTKHAGTETSWKASYWFMVPVNVPTFVIAVDQIIEDDPDSQKGASVEIDCSKIRDSVSESTGNARHFLVEPTTPSGEDGSFDIRFAAFLSSSNMFAGPSPALVLTKTNGFNREEILLVLAQIVSDDEKIMRPCLGLLYTAYSVVIKLSNDDENKAWCLGMLANLHLARYDAFLKMMDDKATSYPMYHIYFKGLEAAISMLDYALKTSQPLNPKRPWLLLSLAMCLQRLYLAQTELENSAEFNATAIRLWDVLRDMGDDEPKKQGLATFAAVALERRFKTTKSLADIDSVIAAYGDAVRLLDDDKPDKQELLNDLVDSVLERLDLAKGEIDQETVELATKGVSLINDTVHDNTVAARAHYNYARSKFLYWQTHAAEVTAGADGLLDIIHAYENALNHLSSDEVTRRGVWSKELGTVYFQRFHGSGDVADLNRSILLLQQAAPALSNSSPNVLQECVKTLALSLFLRFHKTHDFDDVDLANRLVEEEAFIEMEKENSSDAPVGFLNQQFEDYVKYFENLTGIEDIVKSAHRLQDLIGRKDLTSTVARQMDDIGMFLALRLKSKDALAEVSRGIMDILWEVPVTLRSTWQARAHRWCIMLNELLLRKFDVSRDQHYIDKAIEMCEFFAPEVTKETQISPDPEILRCLGSFLLKRFHWFGDISDINRSVQVLEDALSTCQNGHLSTVNLLNSLGSSYLERSQKLGDISDFNKAAIAFQNALEGSSNSHSKSATIIAHNVGLVHLRRLKLTGDIIDADRAVKLYQDIADKHPAGSSEKVEASVERASALLRRFWHLRDPQDVEEAIKVLEDAFISAKTRNVEFQVEILHNLGDAYAERFADFAILYGRFGAIEDINQSIKHYQDAMILLPNSHPRRARLLFDLGRWLPSRYELVHNREDLEACLDGLLTASSTNTASFQLRFEASSLRGYWSQTFRHGDAVESYTIAMELLPKLVWPGLSIPNRHARLLGTGDVIADAVAAAIEAGELEKAFRWFEQGRSIVWTQQDMLRSSHEELARQHPELASRYRVLSEGLGRFEPHDGDKGVPFDEPNLAKDYHRMAQEREELIAEIRRAKGLEDFLRPKAVNEIFPKALRRGTVVAINTSKFRCDALILPPDSDGVIVVHLNDLSLLIANQLKAELHDLLRSKGVFRGKGGAIKRRSPFLRKPQGDPESGFKKILETLWTTICKPVLDRLEIPLPEPQKSPEHMHRIWWCLSGSLAFLPIHAAGLYGQDDQRGSKLSDFVVSSYIPSISALAHSSSSTSSANANLVGIALPEESKLPCSELEMTILRKYSPPFHVESLLEAQATPQNVKSAMERCSWGHFSCHGIQDNAEGNSSLFLAQGTRLTLSDISALHLPHAEFAFLSACQTATGDELLPEESIHLVAGMLFAGYRGAVGTMWSIVDEDGPHVADRFYTELCKAGTPTADKAASSLHAAINQLRTSELQKSFFSWVPFIHYGV
ncbi:hypothetical protein CPC08DRAFT_713959 [Agrocybe pediades]|nr:hypothetical protein CPC08DRAFT_713959 [Agrocybe pediades]